MLRYLVHYTPAKIVPGLLNFLGLLIYARIFTQEQYGRYSYVIAILGLIQSILFPWIRMSCSRFYQQYKKENRAVEFENFTYFIFLMVSIVLSIGWLIFISLYKGDYQIEKLFILGLFVVLSQALFEQLMALSRAKLLPKTFAFNMILKAIIRITTALFLVFLFKVNEEALFIALIIAHSIPIIIYTKNNFVFRLEYLKFSKLIAKKVFNYGFPLTFTFLLVYIINSSDRILIKHFLSESAVGLYSIPYEFTTFTLTNLFMVCSMAFFPVIVKELEHDGILKSRERISQYSSLLLAVTLPSAIFMIMTAPFIAGLLLGENYSSENAIFIIQLMSIATLLQGFKAYFFDYSFQLGQNTYKQIIPVIFSAIANVVANVILLPIYGVIGAVIATLFSYVIGIILSIIIGYKIFPLVLAIKQVVKVLISNFILLFIMMLIPFDNINWLNLILIFIISVTSYLILLLIFNVEGYRNALYNFLRKKVY
ncbi:polysaccharide export protein [Lentibacillus kapialis]|uniref:Polysaccharide export protein n=1 Tax=Lentibacillus kapialis TaxID=340214 RepID=A0A917PWI0_9BACI|nr:oligosaccharide flippase family protein [Lentibacillus kapialis]GGJ95049.1 polysaccharide export protein [Lentibacillus kapialis]